MILRKTKRQSTDGSRVDSVVTFTANERKGEQTRIRKLIHDKDKNTDGLKERSLI